MAPSYDFIKRAFLPVLQQMGAGFSTAIDRYGFYPVGAGTWSIKISPSKEYTAIKIEQRDGLIEMPY